MADWLSKPQSLRARLHNIPPLDPTGFRDCQIRAIENLEKSFQANKPRALIQMATGAGKTFTAITSVYRLLKFAEAKRILFLVDTKNLGEQAEQEFMSYLPNDDNRKFTELYNVQRLKSSFVASSSQVCISTIQRMYSILKDEPLDEAAEEVSQKIWFGVRSQFLSFTTRRFHRSFSTSSLSTSATAPFTTYGGRSSNISMLF
jgi:type I restriction enzyme R subunit